MKDKICENSINKLGLSIFENAKEISESAIFIGVDSGLYHLACCYPSVRKKLFLIMKTKKK